MNLIYNFIRPIGFVVHFWTVIIAFQEEGFGAALISLILPFLSEVYWIFKMFGENNLYAVLTLIALLMTIVVNILKKNSRLILGANKLDVLLFLFSAIFFLSESLKHKMCLCASTAHLALYFVA